MQLSIVVSPRSASAQRAAILAAALLGLAGCTQNLNMEAVRKSVSDGVDRQLSLPISSVDCPPTRPVKAGDAFDCVATPTAGGRLTVGVTQQDGAGNVTWKVVKTEGLLDLGKVEASVRTGLKEQAKVDATVSCGGRWQAAKTGDTFDCQAKVAEQTVGIVVSVTDNEGNISWKTR